MSKSGNCITGLFQHPTPRLCSLSLSPAGKSNRDFNGFWHLMQERVPTLRGICLNVYCYKSRIILQKSTLLAAVTLYRLG